MSRETIVGTFWRVLVLCALVVGVRSAYFAGIRDSLLASVEGLVSAGPFGQVWTLMFSLENPLGRLVNQTILVLFSLSVLELMFTLLGLSWQAVCLGVAKSRLRGLGSEASPPETLADLPQRLNVGTQWLPPSLVAQRVRNLFRLRSQGVLDVTVLKEITGERVGLPGGFARFVAGSLTVLGLIGTVLGLSLAVRDLAPLLGQIKATHDIGVFAEQMLKTLAGMETAFSCTLTGLVCAFMLSMLNFCVQRLQAGFYNRLEEFSNYELVPLLAPTSADHATETFVQKLQDTGETIANMLDRLEVATERYVTGAGMMKEAATDIAQAGGSLADDIKEVGTVVISFQNAADQFVAAGHTLTEQNAQQAALWTTTAQQLQTTTAALQGQVKHMAETAGVLREGTIALQAIRDLPSSLQQVLAEAMKGAIQVAQQHQETLTTGYLDRVDAFLRGLTGQQKEFQQSYADLVLGVQQGVAQLLGGFSGRQDEMVAELRKLNDQMARSSSYFPPPFRGSRPGPMSQDGRREGMGQAESADAQSRWQNPFRRS